MWGLDLASFHNWREAWKSRSKQLWKLLEEYATAEIRVWQDSFCAGRGDGREIFFMNNEGSNNKMGGDLIDERGIDNALARYP
jgi:hypothetical protein